MAKKSGLGRGLDALITEATSESGNKPEQYLPIKLIKRNPKQPRKHFDEVALSELADSIRQNGILQPILVRKVGANYEIVAGERRYQASKKLGLTEVPVIIREIHDDEVFRLAMIENLQRADLSPIEEAQGYRQLLDSKGLTQEGLAKVLSKSRSAIANTLRLLDLPSKVQDYLQQGALTAGHARAILSVTTDDARIKLAKKVVDERLTVRQTEVLAPLYSSKEKVLPGRTPTPKTFKDAAHKLRDILDTNVRVKHVRGKNRIEIEFLDEEDLKRIVEQIGNY